MDYDIDNDILITLVEARPVLWDKTLDMFKDRNATTDAWRQVCCELNEGFEEMENKEKNAFGKAVTKRWGNLRDAFSKSKRKLKECKRSGTGALKIKKYVYADQMQFLNKVYQSREVADSLEDSVLNDDGDADDEQPQPSLLEDIESLSHRKEGSGNSNNTGHRKRRHPDEIEQKMLKALEQPTPNAHMLFFQGLLPHLNKFDDGEVLEFQMGVLQLISKLNDKKKVLNLHCRKHIPITIRTIPCHSQHRFPILNRHTQTNSTQITSKHKFHSLISFIIHNFSITLPANNHAPRKERHLSPSKNKPLHSSINKSANLQQSHLQILTLRRALPHLLLCRQIPPTIFHNLK